VINLWRIWIPGGLCVLGVIVMAVQGFTTDSSLTGVPLFAAGSSIWLANIFYRISEASGQDRDDESDAREYFAEHGHWPDQKPSDQTP
jgi:drug/metabolite transporter (DMT)-like permease